MLLVSTRLSCLLGSRSMVSVVRSSRVYAFWFSFSGLPTVLRYPVSGVKVEPQWSWCLWGFSLRVSFVYWFCADLCLAGIAGLVCMVVVRGFRWCCSSSCHWV